MSLAAATKGCAQQPQGHPHLQTENPRGMAPTWPAESDSQAVTQQYHPAESSAAAEASAISHSGHCHELDALAEAVMQLGCSDEAGSTVQVMKPFLPGFVKALSDVQGASRYGTQNDTPIIVADVTNRCLCMLSKQLMVGIS